jgi:glucose-6-phosphate isomerase
MSKSPTSDKDKEFMLEMAEVVWQKVKGYKIPDCYSEADRLHIFERYWHRAIEKENIDDGSVE